MTFRTYVILRDAKSIALKHKSKTCSIPEARDCQAVRYRIFGFAASLRCIEVDTLTQYDYVGVVTFMPLEHYNDELVPATVANCQAPQPTPF